jgi:hypothetical protein
VPSAGGFWSYVHKDDEAEGARITQLGRDIKDQYEMITGDEIELFLDRDSLDWGDDWKGELDASLESVAFFIPVLTPRYFQSAECRRELNFFARRADVLGVRDLIMPILYQAVPELRADVPDDESMVLVKTFQWEDWTELRFEERSSSSYRRATARLAQRLADADATLAQSAASHVSVDAQPSIGVGLVGPIDDDEDDDAEPGYLDQIAAMSEALPAWHEAITDIGERIAAIGAFTEDVTEAINEGDRRKLPPATTRLNAARQLARHLKEPADAIDRSVQDFSELLYTIDAGYRSLVQVGMQEAQTDDESRRSLCELLNSIEVLVSNSEQAFGSVQQMIDAMSPLEKMSRDLRPVLKRLRKALTTMMQVLPVMQEWREMKDAVDIDCSDLQPST